MKPNKTTLAIKARLSNHIRKTLYKKDITSLKEQEKLAMFDQIFGLNLQMHSELNAYKAKRKEKVDLLRKRQAAPQTKSMKKKLGLIPKSPKINLETTK